MIAVNLVFLVLGCFIDATTMLLVLVPVLLPTVAALQIDPVYFGVVMVFNVTIGLVTPPYGLLLFVLSALARIPLREIVRECWGLIGAIVVALALVVAFPSSSCGCRRRWGTRRGSAGGHDSPEPADRPRVPTGRTRAGDPPTTAARRARTARRTPCGRKLWA